MGPSSILGPQGLLGTSRRQSDADDPEPEPFSPFFEGRKKDEWKGWWAPNNFGATRCSIWWLALVGTSLKWPALVGNGQSGGLKKRVKYQIPKLWYSNQTKPNLIVYQNKGILLYLLFYLISKIFSFNCSFQWLFSV